MYYKCSANLWSIVFKNRLKFSKDGVYECVGKDVYINNQMEVDYISYEGWQKFFRPIDLNEVDISELDEVLQCDLIET